MITDKLASSPLQEGQVNKLDKERIDVNFRIIAQKL